MLKKNRLTLAVSAAIGLGTAAVLPMNAIAQEDELLLEEVVVTGSMIKRIDLDNALPVQVLTSKDIALTGVTNTTDLVEFIPAMQNMITASDSVGGGGGGIRTANLRGIGSQYTLTLLNGRRMAPADSGSSIDVSNIPLAAIERVEVLADGASALYGSDAIAGVVNFILKDSVEETTIRLRGDVPQEDGGESWNFDLVTGFGNLNDDGYSFVFSYSHEDQDALASADRDFAETGFINFSDGGDSLYFENSSANAIPGNAFVYTPGYEEFITAFNPNAQEAGSCAKQTTPSGDLCRFDYTSTLEILPEHKRDSIYLNGKFNFTDNLTGFASILASRYEMTARIAPYPTGEVPLPLDSDLVQNEVFPYLTPEQQAAAGEVTGTWRALPAGNRTTEYTTDSFNFTFGLEGNVGTLDYQAGVTHAITQIDQDYPTGWLLLDEFVEVAGSGAINIFAAQEDFSEEDKAALAPAVYSGDWDEVENTMTSLDASASMPVFSIGGRDVFLAGGADWRTTNYERTISQANADEALLFLSKDTEYELERDQWGIFGEMLFPITDNFEITAALRYDDVGGVKDKANGGKIDDGDDGTTYKISGLWNIVDAVALRASFGTGFKAPSMREIGEPRSDFGVTSGNYACPWAPGTDPKAAWCKPGGGEDQYNVFRAGSADLEFETSEQYSFGIVLTPWDNFDATIDYWNIELEDQVDRLTEQQIFANPDAYYDLFTFKTNSATGKDELAIVQAAANVAQKEASGIDYSFNQGFDWSWGGLDLRLGGTYMIDSNSSLYGSSLGRFGADDEVVFRNKINFGTTLYHGNFQHNINVLYRSGYTDQTQNVEITGTGVPIGQGPTRDVTLDVDDYTTVDYQFRWMTFSDSLGLTAGINNLFDEEPPLSLRTSGAGHQVGWDPRYVDAYGRTFYLQGEFRF